MRLTLRVYGALMILQGMDAEDERARVLESIFGVVALIEQAKDIATICDYIDRLSGLKTKLAALDAASRSGSKPAR